MTADIVIGREPVRQPDARALLVQSSAYSDSLFPAESNHHLDEDGLDRADIAFFLARRAGAVLGCGAILFEDGGAAELKSLFVDPAARGMGLARCILAALKAHAAEKSVTVIRLETGIRQPAAIGLYESAGYRRIDPFGDYRPDPLSVFMEKTIG